ICIHVERRRNQCAETSTQHTPPVRISYLDVIISSRQRGAMRRPAIKVNVVLVTVDVEIHAATRGVGGPDCAGYRRSRSKHGGRDEYCCDCEERNRDAAGKLGGDLLVAPDRGGCWNHL